MTATRKRPPRGPAAVNAWPGRLAAVREDPSDANLQSLCTLLDAIEAWVVTAWDTPAGLMERRDILRTCRADAREANRLVTERMRHGQAAAGRVNAANRRSGGRTTWICGPRPVIRVLGLDIASRCTGVALPNGRAVTIKARTQTKPGPGRMDEQLVELRRLTANAAPQIAAIEGYNPRGYQGMTMVRLAGIGELLRWSLWRRGIPYVEIPPKSLKVYACATGRADKDAMVAAAIEGGADVDDHDQADAWLCRAFLLHALGCPVWPGSARADEAVEAFAGTARALITVNRPRGSMEAPCL